MENITDLVSIIIPVFNIEKYVSECIESIAAQTYKNIQIILVDDGSTDKSGEICDKYAALDGRIEVIHQHNKGLVVARKQGLKNAKGQYIGFVDGDDYVAPDMFERLLVEIKRSNADFVHSGYFQNSKEIIPFRKEIIHISEQKVKAEFLKKAIFGVEAYITPSIWSKLFKAEFIKRNYSQVPNEAQYGEDLISLCICIEEGTSILLLNEAFYYYRHREDSITNEVNGRNLENIFKCYKNLGVVLENYDYYNMVKDSILEYICRNILNKISIFSSDKFRIVGYCYPYAEEIQGKKIVIYGAGAVGRDYYTQISRYTDCDIVAWVDLDSEKYDYPYIKLYGIEALDVLEFDLVLIAVKKEEMAKDIYKQLIQKNIDKDKIIWVEPRTYGILPEEN